MVFLFTEPRGLVGMAQRLEALTIRLFASLRTRRGKPPGAVVQPPDRRWWSLAETGAGGPESTITRGQSPTPSQAGRTGNEHHRGQGRHAAPGGQATLMSGTAGAHSASTRSRSSCATASWSRWSGQRGRQDLHAARIADFPGGTPGRPAAAQLELDGQQHHPAQSRASASSAASSSCPSGTRVFAELTVRSS